MSDSQIDALRADLDNPNVVAGLAMALEQQDSPLLQVALAEALLAADQPAVDAVRAFLGRNALDPVRWREAGWTYRALGRH